MSDWDKKAMINDVEIILKSKELSEYAKKAILDKIMWKWTEFSGKYKGCYYWSEKALEEYENSNKTSKFCEANFRHEHVVPKKVIISYLLDKKNLNSIDVQFISKLFNKILIATVVTKCENDKKLNKYKDIMPACCYLKKLSSYTENDIWSRYIISNINVYNVEWNVDSRRTKTIKNEPKQFI